ncbi:galactose-specific lectin nattectin-like [Syngnathoides biaculeatus]|uniref:galactose-specific lectin nattectin-like n=1 Tax=Syngnathoides biaculeatus TaxID=300417 RepID=UPI002ADE7B12|nr:galactose-specific lectin nattectin-like [Syngnathoides biaculeatus]
MAFVPRLLVLLYGFAGLLTGARSFYFTHWKKIAVNNCPYGWTQLNSKCYIYQSDPRIFADAEDVCNIIGGNLVSIRDDLENTFVLELALEGGNDGEYWIGYNDNLEPDTFIWTDGTMPGFENYKTSTIVPEPNSANGNCVEVDDDDGEWQTESCMDSNPYVCIRDVFMKMSR